MGIERFQVVFLEKRGQAALYLKRFGTELGAIRCGELRALGYGSDGSWPCSALVERAVPLLLDILDHEA